MSKTQVSNNKAVRIGFVGLGATGVYHLKAAAGMPGVEIPALCDVAEARLQEAAKVVAASGRPAPRLYGRGVSDYERLCGEETLDAVVCTTAPRTHAAVCLMANKNGKHVACEGPLVLTMEDAWALLETYEKTKKWSALALEPTLLEGESGANLTLFNMVRHGVLGEMIHCEDSVLRRSGVARDLPANLAGNLSPDKPMSRLIPLMEINRGDRFDSLVSVSSRAAAVRRPSGGAEHAGGDYNASIIHTSNGKLVTLNCDVSTPCPGGYCRLQGTKGVYMSAPGLRGPMIYLDGITSTQHTWESVESYFRQYRHPLLQRVGGGSIPLTWQLLVQALREGKEPFFDIYDSLTSSAIIALTDKSVSNRSRPVEFPDFTRGRWKTRRPIDIA